jgi:hypothetical protein
MKAYWGSGGIAQRILDLGTRRGGEWSASRPWYALDRRLGGPRSRSGHGDEDENSQPLTGLEPPIIQPVAHRHTTELSRLLKWSGKVYILNSTHVTKYLQRISAEMAPFRNIEKGIWKIPLRQVVSTCGTHGHRDHKNGTWIPFKMKQS